MVKFPRQSLRERVADHIIDAIICSELRPGDRIVERRLSQQLGVSQTTLREALMTLEHLGLIRKVDNQGTSVARLTVENVEELYAVRKRLEPYAAELCYGHMKRADYQVLDTAFQKMKSSIAGDGCAGLSIADAEFHREIWRLSGNKVLERTLNTVCTPLFALMFVDVGSYDARRSVDEHLVLLKALKRGGARDVRRIFEQEIESFRLRDVKNVIALQDLGRHRRPKRKIQT